MQTPTYTFLSVSTAKEGKFDELVRIAREPSEKMEGQVSGMIARQVSEDRERNTVVVWVAFDSKETLYNWLETEKGKAEHGDENEMKEIIETFEMYDLTPVSQNFNF
jgi:heme-degrading monooxygenase HmoA